MVNRPFSYRKGLDCFAIAGPMAADQAASTKDSSSASLKDGKSLFKRLRSWASGDKAIVCLGISIFSSCGYHFQGTGTAQGVVHDNKIERIFVAPLRNNTYKPGVENLAYNELKRTLQASKVLKLVLSVEASDAVLSGRVTTASYSPSALTSSDSIFPTTQKTIQIRVATEYQATLNCTFVLTKRDDWLEKQKILQNGEDPTPGATLWSAGFSRSRRFQGNNQKGEYGTTSPLINESEFDRSLSEMAKSMMPEVIQSLLFQF